MTPLAVVALVLVGWTGLAVVLAPLVGRTLRLVHDPVPIRAAAAGCCATVRGGVVGQWATCPGAPRYAARWTSPTAPSRAWRVLLCDEHRDLVDGARPMTDADRQALQLRRDREAAARRGERWIRPRPLQQG